MYANLVTAVVIVIIIIIIITATLVVTRERRSLIDAMYVNIVISATLSKSQVTLIY